MERVCLDCNEVIKGRTDKKFCDDQCRSNYNNKLKSETCGIVKTIDQILKKNRKIIEKLTPEGKSKVSLKKILDAGFNINYHTHLYHTKTGNTYTFCYEFGYLSLDNDMVLLVKRDEII